MNVTFEDETPFVDGIRCEYIGSSNRLVYLTECKRYVVKVDFRDNDCQVTNQNAQECYSWDRVISKGLKKYCAKILLGGSIDGGGSFVVQEHKPNDGDSGDMPVEMKKRLRADDSISDLSSFTYGGRYDNWFFSNGSPVIVDFGMVHVEHYINITNDWKYTPEEGFVIFSERIKGVAIV